MMKIVSTKYDESGNVIGYEIDDGRILSRDRAAEMVRSGRLTGAISGVNENGEKVIHIIPEENMENSINPMNRFSENEWMVYSKKTIF